MGTDQIVDLASFGEPFISDPYPFYAKLRAEGPVHRVLSPKDGPVWLVVGYDEARAALADPALSKDWSRAPRRDDREISSISANMLESDPPHHTRLRRLVAKEFTPRRIEALRPRVQQITDELIDAMLPSGSADLVDALAFPLPMTVICELLGVPSMDREAFRRWSNEIISPTDPAAESAAVAAMGGYLAELITAKRAAPGGDLLSALIRTNDADGDKLSPEELVGMAFLLLVAGHETTVNLIANGVLALLRHPAQLAALRAEPALLDNAVEEMLRYDGPVETSTYRFSTEEVRYGGVVIPAGEPVLISLASAAHDAHRFDGPGRFDIRRDARGHVAFGHGIHHCLGAPLARMEGRIAVRSLLDRCPGLALNTEPALLTWRSGLIIRGPRQLPVSF